MIHGHLPIRNRALVGHGRAPIATAECEWPLCPVTYGFRDEAYFFLKTPTSKSEPRSLEFHHERKKGRELSGISAKRITGSLTLRVISWLSHFSATPLARRFPPRCYGNVSPRRFAWRSFASERCTAPPRRRKSKQGCNAIAISWNSASGLNARPINPSRLSHHGDHKLRFGGASRPPLRKCLPVNKKMIPADNLE